MQRMVPFRLLLETPQSGFIVSRLVSSNGVAFVVVVVLVPPSLFYFGGTLRVKEFHKSSTQKGKERGPLNPPILIEF